MPTLSSSCAWLAATGLLAALLLALPAWVLSVARRDASLADRFWPFLIATPAVLYVTLGPATPQAGWLLALLLAWALRLGLYITIRNWGHGEDRRYARMRDEHGDAFALRSLVTVFGLQAVLAWLVASPLLAASQAGDAPPAWPALLWLGLALGLAGLLIEALADAQMARFRASRPPKGSVMDQGLWRYSRHPNYFGECCVWWGLWIASVGLAGTGALWAVLSPLLMTVLLLRVSGVTLLERDLGTRPAYRDYIARTSAFIPWPPRRHG
ncbi:MAG: DUF1295 domain-containing protein [Burkholderiaceae bacterium]|nr:DUF1295 domain-containing protein [Burkholderiaceae bacterium]